MKWSFKLGRLAGIDIFVHFTFLILLGWIGLAGFVTTGSVVVALASLLLICAVFFIIVLHEMGHALAARHYGIKTRDITLLPIGGVARLERMPEKPAQELVVALAGPAVNVVLAGLLFVVGLFQGVADPESALSFGANIVDQLFWINVGLVLFNMLPAFPMDGGRVLRALLAMRFGPSRATSVAARVGKGMAILFALVGLFGIPGVIEPNIMLALVALFVWMGADAEAQAMRAKAGLAGMSVRGLMVRRFMAVAPDDTIGSVAEHVHHGYQQDFPVVVDGRVVGLLTGSDLLYAVAEYGEDARVFRVMRRDVPTVGPDEPLENGLSRLSEGLPVVPVVDAGRLVGLLTAEHVTRYLWERRTGRRDDPSRSGWGSEAGVRA